MNRKVLITGTNGGLGSFLEKKYENSDCITRKNPLNEIHYNTKYDLIIHCAFNQNRDDLDFVNKKCYEDNIVLIQNLLKISHYKFIFISTCQTPPDINTYVVMKRICEFMVQDVSKNYLIIRPSCMVGDNMKKNSIYKLMNGEDITLTEDSVNDFILFDDVYDTIESYENGIYYLLSSKKFTMGEISKIYNKKINFGKWKYDIGNLETDIDIKKTSLEVLEQYFGKINE